MSLREKLTTKEIFETMKSGMEILFPKEKELTFRDKITKESYLHLKSMNKLYSGSASAIRSAAIRNKGTVRGHLRFLKTVEGQKARLYHVALCFLRGKKYSEVEPKVEDKNKLTVKQIYGILQWATTRNYYGAVLEKDITKFLES